MGKYAEKRVVKPQVSKRRTILLKGPSGVGKTHQFRTLAAAGLNGLYVDVEAKITSLADMQPDLWLIRQPDVPLTPAEKTRMLEKGESHVMELVEEIRAGDHPYDFVYFDSMMRYAEELLMFLKYIKGLSGYDLWGALGEKMKMALKLLTSMASSEYPKPVHFIATWGVESVTSAKGQRRENVVVQGKVVAPWVDYFFDDVFRLGKEENAETGEVKFVAYTGGTDEFDAKVSSAGVKLPFKIADPSLARILEVLGATRTTEATETKK